MHFGDAAMNASLGFAVLSLSLVGMAGCTGMHERPSRSTYVAPQHAPSIMDSDDAYVAAVERIARRRGIEIVWINVPRKQWVAKQDDK